MIQKETYLNHYPSYNIRGIFVNIIFKGRVKEILESMVEQGYANSQSEAARLAVVQFGEKHFNETELVNKKLDFIDEQIKKGKRKVLNAEQALGKYSKHLKS